MSSCPEGYAVYSSVCPYHEECRSLGRRGHEDTSLHTEGEGIPEQDPVIAQQGHDLLPAARIGGADDAVVGGQAAEEDPVVRGPQGDAVVAGGEAAGQGGVRAQAVHRVLVDGPEGGVQLPEKGGGEVRGQGVE